MREMRHATIESSFLRGTGRRMTAGFHLAEDQAAMRTLAQCTLDGDRIGDLVHDRGVFKGPIFKRQYVSDSSYGVPYVSANDLIQADVRPAGFLSRRALGPLEETLLLRPGMTLVTCSGMNLGRAIWGRHSLNGLCASHDLIRIEADPSKILPGYLCAFLASRYGRTEIRRQIYGGNIKHIEPHHIAGLPVPRAGRSTESRVHQLMVESGKLLSSYQLSVQDGTRLLFQSLKLDNDDGEQWHAKGRDLGFGVAFPPLTDSLRALNFNPRFAQACEAIQSGPWRRLDQVCEPGTIRRGNRFKRVDAAPEHAVQLLGQKQLFRLRPEGRWIARSAVGDDVRVDDGTILVAARGTLGEKELYCRAEFITGRSLDFAFSEDILRIVADQSVMPRGCLFAFLRSETAFRMLRSISVGTKIQDHHYQLLPGLPVPYPPAEIRQEVDRRIRSAYRQRDAGVAAELEAIALVESAIEQAT